ncbi:hypothetical protein Sjap_019202 [Stephania japonica]|uniref:C3H1-type domain-containing protein n=1 Tax=Stephania japonica TaxID=461633 RepID=A0AAP0F5J2_9MAGN
MDMSAPVTPSQFFAQPRYLIGGEALGFWPPMPVENEQSLANSNADYPPFKKPRTAEGSPPDSASNHTSHPRNAPPIPPVSKGIGRIFFKTRLCAKFKAGTCPYGSNCNFAHGIEDMRKPPPNWQEIVASHGGDDRGGPSNWDDDQKIINRMKLCKKFYNGEECPYGERCNFLHEDPGKFREDSGRFRESSVISVGTNGGSQWDNGNGPDQFDCNGFMNTSSEANRSNLKPVFWKTRICNKWETTGHCPFGEKCHFAHGQAELQKYGSMYEVETENATLAPSKHFPKESSPSNNTAVAGGASCNPHVPSKKCLLKWKGLERINRIYADWIDDIPLARESPSKVGN